MKPNGYRRCTSCWKAVRVRVWGDLYKHSDASGAECSGDEAFVLGEVVDGPDPK